MREHKYRHHRVDIFNSLYQLEKETLELYKSSNSATNHEFRKKLVKLLNFGVEYWLNEKEKETIKLYFIEYKTESEIAQIQKVNQSTVSRNLKRAKNKLFKYCYPYFEILK